MIGGDAARWIDVQGADVYALLNEVGGGGAVVKFRSGDGDVAVAMSAEGWRDLIRRVEVALSRTRKRSDGGTLPPAAPPSPAMPL